MTERYYEITCDVCGEIEWSCSGETLREMRTDGLLKNWRFRGQLAICHGCWDAGERWKDATLHCASVDK